MKLGCSKTLKHMYKDMYICSSGPLKHTLLVCRCCKYIAVLQNILFDYNIEIFIHIEPSACELIEVFLAVDNKTGNSKPTSERVVDVDAPPTPPTSGTPAPAQYTRKQLALKILALRVAATLHWNLGKYTHV